MIEDLINIKFISKRVLAHSWNLILKFLSPYNYYSAMGSLTLTDIPYEVFTDHILPLCSLKELGALSMVATELWPLGKDESLWKYFYIQGLKGAIPKD